MDYVKGETYGQKIETEKITTLQLNNQPTGTFFQGLQFLNVCVYLNLVFAGHFFAIDEKSPTESFHSVI